MTFKNLACSVAVGVLLTVGAASAQTIKGLKEPTTFPIFARRLNVAFVGAVKVNKLGEVMAGFLAKPNTLGLHDSKLNVDFRGGAFVMISESGVVAGILAHDTVLNVPYMSSIARDAKVKLQAVKFKGGTLVSIGAGGNAFYGTVAESTTLTSRVNNPDFLSVTFPPGTEISCDLFRSWSKGRGQIAPAYYKEIEKLKAECPPGLKLAD